MGNLKRILLIIFALLLYKIFILLVKLSNKLLFQEENLPKFI